MNSQSPIRGSRIFFYFFLGGGGRGLPENNPGIFLVLNFNILQLQRGGPGSVHAPIVPRG